MHKIQKMSIILLFFYCFSFCVLEKSLIQDNISSYQVVSSQSVFYISNQVGYYYDLSSTKSQTITLNGGNGSHYLFQGKDNHLLYIYMKTKSFTYTLIDSQKSDTVSFPLSYIQDVIQVNDHIIAFILKSHSYKLYEFDKDKFEEKSTVNTLFSIIECRSFKDSLYCIELIGAYHDIIKIDAHKTREIVGTLIPLFDYADFVIINSSPFICYSLLKIVKCLNVYSKQSIVVYTSLFNDNNFNIQIVDDESFRIAYLPSDNELIFKTYDIFLSITNTKIIDITDYYITNGVFRLNNYFENYFYWTYSNSLYYAKFFEKVCENIYLYTENGEKIKIQNVIEDKLGHLWRDDYSKMLFYVTSIKNEDNIIYLDKDNILAIYSKYEIKKEFEIILSETQIGKSFNIIYHYEMDNYPDDKCIIDITICFSSCKTCTGVGIIDNHKCSSCKDKYYPIYGETSNCYQKPLSGYYLDSTNQFRKCFSTCSECTGDGNLLDQKCTSCNPGHYLDSNNNCVILCPLYHTDTYCVSECPSGTFLMLDKSCQSCPKGKFYLLGGCVDSCLPFAESEGKCVSSCKDNEFLTPSKTCISCEGSYFEVDKCVSQCSIGKVLNDNYKVCLTCAENNNKKPYYYNGECKDSITKHQYVLQPYNIVKDCDWNIYINECMKECPENTIVEDRVCKLCKINEYVLGNECKKECPYNYIITNESVCKICNGYIDHNSCFDTCPDNGHIMSDKKHCLKCNGFLSFFIKINVILFVL